MNRYISTSYTRCKNTIYRAGAAVVSAITSFIVAFYLVERSPSQIRVRLYGITRIHGIPADFGEANDIIANFVKEERAGYI